MPLFKVEVYDKNGSIVDSRSIDTELDTVEKVMKMIMVKRIKRDTGNDYCLRVRRIDET